MQKEFLGRSLCTEDLVELLLNLQDVTDNNCQAREHVGSLTLSVLMGDHALLNVNHPPAVCVRHRSQCMLLLVRYVIGVTQHRFMSTLTVLHTVLCDPAGSRTVSNTVNVDMLLC